MEKNLIGLPRLYRMLCRAYRLDFFFSRERAGIDRLRQPAMTVGWCKKNTEKFGYFRGKEYLCKPIIICLWV